MRPIDADALKERAIRVSTVKLPHTFFKAVGTREIDKAPTIEQPTWISVEDGLPETIACSAGTAYSEAVIVFTTGKKVLIAIFDGENFQSDGIDYWNAEHDEVTHWRPLPQPPKGVE